MSSALFPRLELKATLPYPAGDRMPGESWNAITASILENTICGWAFMSWFQYPITI